jgi:hypothetical protein
VQQLADQRTQGTAGGDDRAFRSERTTAADGHRRGNRLEPGQAWFDATLIEQHLFHRFGNAMATDGAGAVARHDADDDAADGGYEDDPKSKLVVGRAAEREIPATVECKIGNQSNQAGQRVSRHGNAAAEQDRQRADPQDAPPQGAELARHVHVDQG